MSSLAPDARAGRCHSRWHRRDGLGAEPGDATLTPELNDYCFSQQGLFVIPIDALSAAGVSTDFQAELRDRGAMPAHHVDLFQEAFAMYWTRCRALSRVAPRHWFPPRAQHICVVTRPGEVRPYFQPFRRNSWLVYARDFDPQSSTAEFAAYQLLHAERIGLLEQIVPALIANLSYFLVLSQDELDGFVDGCRRTDRPDAAGYRALADAMPDVRRLYHDRLRRPQLEVPGARHMPSTGLIIPSDRGPRLQELEEAWAAAAQEAVDRHVAAHGRPAPRPGARIAEWLSEKTPPLIVTERDGRILWDVESPAETDELLAALRDVTTSGEESILADLATVGRHSRRFLDSLRHPAALVDPAPYITAGGLSYIHKERKLVAYDIGPGDNEARLWQPAPPYERWMLAARTVHEWGHLAAESGWVGVPSDLKEPRKALKRELAALFEEIHASAPAAVRASAGQEVAELRQRRGSLGEALVRGMMVRIEDFQSNLLATRYLTPDEMDTYVRNNVSSHVQEYGPGAIYGQLTRHAYEFQYLRLSRIDDPLRWFLASTWFRERFIAARVLTEAQCEGLFRLVGRICDCYRVDEDYFDFAAL